MKNFHLNHLTKSSPWPFLCSFMAFNAMMGLVLLFQFKGSGYLWGISFLFLVLLAFCWWEDIGLESIFEGFHTEKVKKGLSLGMILFITSEIMFFVSFFWTFIHYSLNPSEMLGGFPPKSVNPFNPLVIPLFNTLILISSGATVTMSHHAVLLNKSGVGALILTIFLGLLFSCFQMFEYSASGYSINESTYSGIFFMATGFHGFHVLVGSLFLLKCLVSYVNYSNVSNLSFEFSIWYWHFVDLVWLFLYSLVYWWSI